MILRFSKNAQNHHFGKNAKKRDFLRPVLYTRPKKSNILNKIQKIKNTPERVRYKNETKNSISKRFRKKSKKAPFFEEENRKKTLFGKKKIKIFQKPENVEKRTQKYIEKKKLKNGEKNGAAEIFGKKGIVVTVWKISLQNR